MLVIDEAPPPNLRRATHLGFEDFLEAIVRVALLAPLPSAAQVKASGCGDAGECVKKLEDMEPSKLRRWASERAAGSPACTLYETLPYTSLPEPPERRVEALLSFVIRTVKGGTQVNVAEGLSPVEVAQFQYSRSGSRPILSTIPPTETHGRRVSRAALGTQDGPPRGLDRQQSSTMGHELTFRLGHEYNPH